VQKSFNYAGCTPISHVKILAPCAKGAENGVEKMGVFVTGKMKSFFFVT